MNEFYKWNVPTSPISKEEYEEFMTNGRVIGNLGGYHDLTGRFNCSHRVEYGKYVYKVEHWGRSGVNENYGKVVVDLCDNQEGDGI